VLIDQPLPAKSRPIPKWIGIGATSLLALLAAGVVIALTQWPFTPENVRKALEEASGRPVQIRTFITSYFPPGCTAEGIRFLRHKHPDLSPVITVDKLSIQASFTGIFHSPKRLAAVRIVGMHMFVTSKQADEGPEYVELNAGPGGKSLAISTITADGTVLEFVRRSGDEAPYVLKIDKLALTEVGSGAPMQYRAELTNSVPPGVIRAEGTFGPWNPGNIGATAVSGTYAYNKIDLSHFHSIYGMGHARGEFAGPLERIRTHGRVDVAGFGVEGSHHSVPMTTDYEATVNGTNGDVQLDPAVARFQHTRLEVRGWIAHQEGESGKTASFDVSVPEGRVDDLLALFDDGQPGMSGPVEIRGHFVWPPGPAAFLHKIRIDLTFGMQHSRLTSADTQGTIDRLGESGEGEKKAEIAEDLRLLPIGMRGAIRVRNSVATISNGRFEVPGADAGLRGTYGLTDRRVDLKGTLHTNGDLSETTSGVKALLVKIVTPLFRKRGNERIVPFRITGARGQANVGIDWKRQK
jgi:hypothetical protein